MLEAVANNVFGTLTRGPRAARHGAAKFVLISTDKAVHPVERHGGDQAHRRAIIRELRR